MVSKWLPISIMLLVHAAAAAVFSPAAASAVTKSAQSWKGDFDALLERRAIRLLVPYNQTFYYNDRGREQGLITEISRHFERFINRKHAKKLGGRRISVVLLPISRDRLLPALVTGLGDIAAGYFTITDEPFPLNDHVSLVPMRTVAEVVLTGPGAKPVTGLEELAGRRLHVRKSSGAYESLSQLNRRFQLEGRPLTRLIPVPAALEDEDMMEMLNAGMLETIVVDDWKADIWRKIFPGVIVNKRAAVQTGIRKGWAIRKNSPGLSEELNDFFQYMLQHQEEIEYPVVKHNRRSRRICNPIGRKEWQRFNDMWTLFRRYGDQYGFDPLMLAALGFQESRLEQSARGSHGAVGVMQLLPATGKAMGAGNVAALEPNIKAGAKYMHYLQKQYFRETGLREPHRTLFTFAAYNAGPGRIAKIRQEAAGQGLDPDQWFNHVEMAAARKIGLYTAIYVRNIYKYYVAYKLALEAADEKPTAGAKPAANR
ncbi:MAG: transglycosylase SLT domain-containing protein [Thermodesulfobacteriota bacterium]